MKPPCHHTHPRVVTHDGVKLRLRMATLAEQKEYDEIRVILANRAKGLNDDGSLPSATAPVIKQKNRVPAYISSAKASVELA